MYYISLLAFKGNFNKGTLNDVRRVIYLEKQQWGDESIDMNIILKI